MSASGQIEFADYKTAWAIWVNTDLTEGRGEVYPMAIAHSKTAARRMGKGMDAQGCNARIEEVALYRINGCWYGPIYVYPSTCEDDYADARENRRLESLKKARAAGLSEEDIKNLYADIALP